MQRSRSRIPTILILGWLTASCAAPEPDASPAEAVEAIAHRVDRDRDGDRDRDHREHPRRPIRSLADAAARTHRLVGTAVDAPFLIGDPVYAATLAAEFSYLTPGNETKWGSLQPVDADHWSFGPADELDVRIANLPGDLVTRLAVERQVFHRAVAACVQVAGCETLTTWGSPISTRGSTPRSDPTIRSSSTSSTTASRRTTASSTGS